ncbi:hypothetical protein Geob_1502 [Geotalea daltonii FRC-32]|uniref:Uncharacterized protein n=1 Tax=Geotalea daltonii (strain DSM 22248 / JCM 15807 / FRC-32) TaxID=316067 RepID=B9M5A6_GEODF|nr:MXAN_6640 family putative metalloprotease [Geotalea daltonii]ACM19861.1 hypothetical protein Geob_1502 [Geotalea daltonii FRC-32]
MMKNLRLLLVTLLALFPSLVTAGTLDTYYLQRFGALYGTQQQTAGVVSSQPASPRERCLTPLHHGLSRDWPKLSTETRKTLAKYLAKPSWADEQVYISTGGHFKIHYAGSGVDAPPSTAWVQTVAATFEEVYNSEVVQMGYRAAPTSAGPYDIYLQNMGARAFGITETDIQSSPGSNSFTSFITIDNDFSAGEFGTQITEYTPQKALQITAAHEYHHAIQYGYNYYFDIWFAEVTATWIEDEVYDGVNQLYLYVNNYLTKTMSLDAAAQSGDNSEYGRWIFNRYLTERYAQSPVVRQIWEHLATQSSPGGGADIPMLPVIDTVLRSKGSSIDNDFFSFSKRLYLRDWFSHKNDISLIHPVVPKQAFSAYPVSSGTSPGLPHYSFAFYRFVKSATAPQDLVLRLSQSQGIKVAAFRKNTSGSIDQFSQAADGTITIPSFNASGTEEVMLLICNNSSSDNQVAYFNTDGSQLPSLPGGTTTASSGGKSGCFIATAAYGSYLHPKVTLLRQFRDHYLLTNAPGRAFVSLYYRVSPPLAAFIAEHATARTLCRVVLAPVIFFVEHSLALPLILIIFGGVFFFRRAQRHSC